MKLADLEAQARKWVDLNDPDAEVMRVPIMAHAFAADAYLAGFRAGRASGIDDAAKMIEKCAIPGDQHDVCLIAADMFRALPIVEEG